MAEIEILHHDDRIVVLDKPPGLLSVPGIGPDNQDCLARRIERDFGGARIVHRLDRETSGVIVMPLDADSHRALGRQFETRQVEKRYVAVVHGHVEGDSGSIDLPLRKDMDRPPRHMVDCDLGRPALTHYRVLSRDGDRSRLELRPTTGRSHQLRVHLSAIGHPILGDDLYAPPEVASRATRLLLHAESLTIAHPQNGERLTFTCPCPF
jgi:tRNA pseudouridine32 synthase/23S rRNA pseudouridine746 synthase